MRVQHRENQGDMPRWDAMEFDGKELKPPVEGQERRWESFRVTNG
jgi:hypothetical protein